jgi:release factor glutamine methyltransferase
MKMIDSFESDIAKLGETFNISRSEAISEVKIIFAYANDLPSLNLIMDPTVMLESTKIKKYKKLFKERLQGKSVAYILGRKEFYGLAFSVNDSVLVPRPDTELLVDLAIEKIERYDLKRVLDLGTGSGAIAVSLAVKMPNLNIVATDNSAKALEVAVSNADVLCPQSPITFLRSDWFSKISGEFDLIVSNPPYIALDDSHLNLADLRFEPKQALVSGADGLDALRLIISQSRNFLAKNGWLLVEHGYEQRGSCLELLGAGGFSQLFCDLDLGGNPRVSGGKI